MNNDLIGRDYQNLLSDLYLIKNKLERLSFLYSDFRNSIRDNYLVDNEIAYNDLLLFVNDNVKFINDELNNVVIPLVNDRL